MDFMEKIYIAGHTGKVGRVLLERMRERGYENIVVRTHQEMDLLNRVSVEKFFSEERPRYAFYCAGAMAGTTYYDYPKEQLLYNNMMMQINFIMGAVNNGVGKIIFLSSAANYGPYIDQPYREEDSLKTIQQNAGIKPYLLAKMSGQALCEYYNGINGCHCISLLPAHIYGYEIREEGHELVADCLMKLIEVKRNHQETVQLDIWGTGTKTIRQFIHVADLADAMIYLMNHYDGNMPLNVARKEMLSWNDIIIEAKRVVGYNGEILYRIEKKELENARELSLDRLHKTGWEAKISMNEGIERFYKWYACYQ